MEKILKIANNFFTPDKMAVIGGGILKTVFILILAKIALSFGDALINRLFRPREGKFSFDESKALTLGNLLKSLLRYIVYFMVLGALLEVVDVDVKPLLAGAGILGLAVGFGAQNLVRDVISGFFILLENQYSIGEYISTGQLSGIVEEMGLRVTKLRDWGGELHIIPNGTITQVTNFNRGYMRALVEVSINYEEDINKALEILEKVSREFAEEKKDIIKEGPQVLGIESFGPSEIVIRIIAKTVPMEQWPVERELRRRIKDAFDAAGIEAPYPRRVMMATTERRGIAATEPVD